MDKPNETVSILQSKNKESIKELISSEDQNLRPALRIISLEGFQPEPLSKKRANHKPIMKRRAINKVFYRCVKEVKSGHNSALLWLKKNMDSKVCDTIFEDNGFSGTKFQILKEKLNYTVKSNQFILAKKIRENCHQYLKTGFNITYNGISRFFLITVMYLDLSMDSIVLFIILFVLGPTLTDQSLFSTQIAILLLLSIVVPGMLTAIDIAYNRPVVVAGPDAWVRFKKLDKTESKKELTFLRILIVLLSPIVPALIVLSDEKAKHKTELLKDKCNQKDYIVQDSDVDKSEQLDAFINECRLGLLTFKRFELSLELVTQLAIHVSMILLTKTKFPLESGLQSIFRNSEEEDENSDRGKGRGRITVGRK